MLNIEVYSKLLKLHGQIYAVHQLITQAHKYVYEYEYSNLMTGEKDPDMHELYAQLKDACNEIFGCTNSQLGQMESTLVALKEKFKDETDPTRKD